MSTPESPGLSRQQQFRDEVGRYAGSGRGGGATISAGNDDPGNLRTQTAALVNRPVGGRGGGMAATPVGRPASRDYGAGFRAMGYSPAGDSPAQNEGPGQHQVQTPQGPASRGADVPAEGISGAGAGEAAAGGAEAAGAASGLAELAPLALAL